MYSGIITDVGEVVRADEKRGHLRLYISTHFNLEDMDIGASVGCSGCCLTLVDKDGGCMVFDVSNETLSKTTLGRWEEGTKVNLERSLRLGDEIGGHMISGHVDGLATLEEIAPDGDSQRLSFSVPEHLAPYIAPKGSVALDGISLTVNEVDGCRFGVNIIPHTWAATNLSALGKGDQANIEVDMLARYVARILGKET